MSAQIMTLGVFRILVRGSDSRRCIGGGGGVGRSVGDGELVGDITELAGFSFI